MVAISDIMLIVSLENSRAKRSIPVFGRRLQALSVSTIPRKLNAFGYALLEFPDISGSRLGRVSLSDGDAAPKPVSPGTGPDPYVHK
jgi:hypothetical protein